MGKIINISDKLSLDRPRIEANGTLYEVNDSLETVLKFEESYGDGDIQSMLECMKVALGETAYEEMNFEQMSFKNVQVWFFAVMAAMQDVSYEDIEARFRQFSSADNN